MAQFVTHNFQPIFNQNSRVLILGTMPSPKSREQGFYYGHPQNRFWRVLPAVLDVPAVTTQDEKTQLLLNNGIALWDVLASCSIEGAADSTIKEPIVNSLDVILSKASIQAIFFDGKKAAELYHRHYPAPPVIPTHTLPSTSPANFKFNMEALCEAYSQILPYLKKERA